MTVPNYTDKDEVNGLTRADIRSYDCQFGSGQLASAALILWEARDQARETAALQDAAIHKSMIRLHALEKCSKVLRWFANANEENHTTHCFYCAAPLEEGHADPCGVVDAKRVLADLDKTEEAKA